MTPTFPLFDAQLERLFVAALIRDPGLLLGELEQFAVTDLTDFHAVAAFTALRNVEARGEAITADALYLELSKQLSVRDPDAILPPRGHREHPLAWFDALTQLPVPADPPIYGWAHQILELKAGLEAAIGDAEPLTVPPRRTPRGPRADNTEPVRLAEAFRRYSYERDGSATLVRWARAWWRYNGSRYIELDDELLDRDIIAFLDVVVAPQQVTDRKTGTSRTENRRVTHRTKTLQEVRKALTFVMPTIAGGAPQWTEENEDDPPAESVVVCANGILDLRTLTLTGSTPRLFATNAIGAPWLPEAPEPTNWIAFLRSLWGTDTESIQTLQQIFGYLLTTDTSQQKIFAIIGPPRSGKGTIARILKALLGDDAVVNPTLQSLERPFGLAPLVGKTVAVIGDARLGGHTDQQQVVERLLSISGEDSLSIDRKNRDPINVRLRVRVMLLSNELPRLYDTSGALASRFVILTLSKSFLGEEDTGLEARLLAELPGIFRWALDGRADLHERGRFLEPLASAKAVEHLRSISNPLGVFLDECCVIEPGAQVEVDAVYEKYVGWCEGNGREPANKQVLGRDLHTLHPELVQSRPRRPDGKRVRMYEGIRCL